MDGLHCSRAVTVESVEGYRRLRNHLDNYRQIPVLDFDERAADVFQTFRSTRIKAGTMDLKIAAIVVARNGKLLSRNLRDFAQVPNLVVEDWTRR
jgi:tRNA(fMet)-specific endonuclease VapC